MRADSIHLTYANIRVRAIEPPPTYTVYPSGATQRFFQVAQCARMITTPCVLVRRRDWPGAAGIRQGLAGRMPAVGADRDGARFAPDRRAPERVGRKSPPADRFPAGGSSAPLAIGATPRQGDNTVRQVLGRPKETSLAR